MKNVELTKVELFNAKNAGRAIEKGTQINVIKVGTFADVDKDGDGVTVTAIKDEDGSIYTTISGTIAKSVDLLMDVLEDSTEPVKVIVNEGKSNNGREFYQLQIVE